MHRVQERNRKGKADTVGAVDRKYISRDQTARHTRPWSAGQAISKQVDIFDEPLWAGEETQYSCRGSEAVVKLGPEPGSGHLRGPTL